MTEETWTIQISDTTKQGLMVNVRDIDDSSAVTRYKQLMTLLSAPKASEHKEELLFYNVGDKCPSCENGKIKEVPAGISKPKEGKPGKPYAAFLACDQRCGFTEKI